MNESRRPRYEFWWQALVAIPPSRSSAAYQRLSRVFRDQTRPTKADPATGRRGHEFTDPSCETHLTVALWENFVLFPPAAWLARVWSLAGLHTALGVVRRCNWSYQWAEHGKRGARHCDLVLEYEDGNGAGVVVIEAKRPGSSLSEKDLDPGYYLEIPQLAEFSRRSIVYLIDDAGRTRTESRVRIGSYDVGFLTWVQLADVQLDSVDSLQVSAELRAYVAGSLYRTYVERGITPSRPPIDYLGGEPSADDVVNKRAGSPLGAGDWGRPLWRLSHNESVA